jgi:hypothetical protein
MTAYKIATSLVLGMICECPFGWACPGLEDDG